MRHTIAIGHKSAIETEFTLAVNYPIVLMSHRFGAVTVSLTQVAEDKWHVRCGAVTWDYTDRLTAFDAYMTQRNRQEGWHDFFNGRERDPFGGRHYREGWRDACEHGYDMIEMEREERYDYNNAWRA